MAEELGTLVAKLQADVSDLKRGLQTGRQELSQFKSMAAEAGASVKRALAFAGVALGLYELTSKLKEFSMEAARVGARTETMQIAMYQVGKNAGMSAEALDWYTEEIKKAGITSQEAMNAITRFLTAGLDLNKLKELATRARDIAVIAGMNTSEALNRLVYAIVSQQQEMFRTLGIRMGNLDDILKRHAVAMGVEKEDLNEVTKANIVLGEVLTNTARMAGTAAAADETVGKQLASMARYAEEAKNALWALFQPIYAAAVQEMTRGYMDLTTWAKANAGALAAWGTTIGGWVRSLAEGIRWVTNFVQENKQLLSTLAELIIFYKAAGWISSFAVTLGGGVGAIKTAVKEAGLLLGIIRTLTAGPWTIAITVSLIGLTAVYNKLREVQRMGLPSGMERPFWPWELSKPVVKEPGKFVPELEQEVPFTLRGKFTMEDLKRPEIRAQMQQFVREAAPEMSEAYQAMAEEARKKAEAEAPGTAAKGEKGKGKGKEEDPFAEYLRFLEQKRQAELAEAQGSLEILKATNDKKKAELEKALAEGILDGQDYQEQLRGLEAQELKAGLDLIEKKKAAQKAAYADALADLARQEISPEARSYREAALAAANRMQMAKLAGEASRFLLENEKKVTEELTKQVKLRKQWTEAVESLEELAAFGPIEEQEARIRGLIREWQKTRNEAIEAGMRDLLPRIDAAFQKKIETAKTGEYFNEIANQIATGISGIIDTITTAGGNLKQSLNNFFRNLFKVGLEPGFKQLVQWLQDGLSKVFGSLGKGIASGLATVIGLIGMMIFGGGEKTWTPSGVETGITAHEAVRGVIAGPTSIPIAEIGESLQDALVLTNDILSQIEENTRASRAELALNISVPGLEQSVGRYLEKYFDSLLQRWPT